MNYLYIFNSGEELLELAKKYKMTFGEIAKRYEAERSRQKISTVRNKMKLTRDVMYESVRKGLKSIAKTPTKMSGGDAHKLFLQLNSILP